MTYSQALQYWNALSPEQKQMFYNYASKSEGQHTAFEWFNYLVPDTLKDDPSEVEVYMNGGTVVTTDGDVVDISDKDLSRVESGHNGGEYTTDNTIMEDSSVNRARGAEDMSSSEYADANATNAFEAEAVDGAEVFASTEAAEAYAEAGSDFFGAVGDVFSDMIAPAIGAYTVGKLAADQCESTEDKIAWGALASGLGALACMTPPGQAALGLYCGGKLIYRAAQWASRYSPKPTTLG